MSVPGPESPTKPASTSSTSAPASSAEITIDEDIDLGEIAELARKIEERTK